MQFCPAKYSLKIQVDFMNKFITHKHFNLYEKFKFLKIENSTKYYQFISYL